MKKANFQSDFSIDKNTPLVVQDGEMEEEELEGAADVLARIDEFEMTMNEGLTGIRKAVSGQVDEEAEEEDGEESEETD